MLFIEVLLLTAALSVDSFAAAVSYGICGMKISFFHTLIISIICSGFLIVSVILADFAEQYIPKLLTVLGSFLILFITGFIKFFQKPEVKQPEKLSFTKSVLFAISMSMDGIAAGFGAGLAEDDGIVLLMIIAPMVTFFTIFIGNLAGLKLNRRAPSFIQKIGGAVIMLIAVIKLF